MIRFDMQKATDRGDQKRTDSHPARSEKKEKDINGDCF
jgi:hypothetical protein